MKLTDLKKKLLTKKEFRAEFEKHDLALEVSQKILEIRIVNGLTQLELANLISTKQSAIARAESGNSLPSLSFLNKIASVLGTELCVDFKSIRSIQLENMTSSFYAGVVAFRSPEVPYLNPQSIWPNTSASNDSVIEGGML